ncbi:MAG: DNA translocase FtsK 4TM domain-containing protein [Anaerolineaceae bacterium]|nr:DNA translocase FtsK 4TM domain-containing protein [Anaerolineaceae bacterium]
MRKPVSSQKPNKKKFASSKQPQTSLHQFINKKDGDLVVVFSRFGWDIIGIALIVSSLLTLFGNLEISSGIFITWMTEILQRTFGWGSYILSLYLLAFGIYVLRRQFNQAIRRDLSRIIALEMFFFVLLAIFSIIGGNTVERAEAGKDGGLVGWGLSIFMDRILPDAISTLLLFLIAALLIGYSFGMFQLLGSWLEEWLNKPEKSAIDPENVQLVDPQLQVKQVPQHTTEVKHSPPRSKSTPLPSLGLLLDDPEFIQDQEYIHATALRIEKTLEDFGIPARVIGFRAGPSITQYAVEPGFIEKTNIDGNPIKQKIRVSQISALNKDLALALSASRLRIEAPVPGQSFVGIEVPNPSIHAVRLRSILESPQFKKINTPLALGLGRDVSGQPVIADLAAMPHLLIAGTTGSGKSVCITSLALGLVMNNTPDQLRLAMLDPKMVELVRFNGLPHLLGKVETEPERMLAVLQWSIAEMDRRYRLLEKAKVRDIIAYNSRAIGRDEEPLPKIVLFIDELADLMMSAPEQTEYSLVRLAQLARAVGIHLIVATQRPSTDVLTGLIKANFPARIAFSVASMMDSRVILDSNGAETLLGKGDMLFLNPEASAPTRAQGVFIHDQEIDAVIAHWQLAQEKSSESPWEDLVEDAKTPAADDLMDRAIELVRNSGKASASMLQRKLRIGYPRAARLMDELEEMGVVGPSKGGGKDREVLVSDEEEPTLEQDSSRSNEEFDQTASEEYFEETDDEE